VGRGSGVTRGYPVVKGEMWGGAGLGGVEKGGHAQGALLGAELKFLNPSEQKHYTRRRGGKGKCCTGKFRLNCPKGQRKKRSGEELLSREGEKRGKHYKRKKVRRGGENKLYGKGKKATQLRWRMPDHKLWKR